MFLVCAVIGGTVFIFQFVLALIGMGGDELDFADDIPDDVDVGDPQGDVLDHGSTWLFGVISFRTVVAALTFFGLAGIASDASGQHSVVSLVIALAAGAAAMFGVHWMMRLLYGLGQDGTVRVERSVGKRGVVYIPIPKEKSGAGKVQLRLQGRIVEYQAMTSAVEKLPTGARVVVVEVISPTTLGVEPILEHAEVDAGDA